MTMSDPIADMLTRIRNANTAKHDTVDVPSSKMKLAIANILLDEGYIEKYELIEDGVFKTIHITLKYGADKNEKVITGLKRISKPGLRVYAGSEDLPKVLGGLGTAVISTNKGVITDKEARKLGVGGEVLCYICLLYTSGTETDVVGENNVVELDCKKALALLKLKMCIRDSIYTTQIPVAGR